MGNSKTKQDRNKLSSPESYCFYSANNQEQHVYLKQMDSFLLISHGLGNAPFKTIELDKDFKVLSELGEQRAIIVSFNTSKGKSTCILRMETIQEFQMWTTYLKVLKRPSWDMSTNLFCKICAKEFGFMRRQHHCRRCGIVVCKDHSKNKVFLPDLGYMDKQRICNICHSNMT